MSCASGVLAGLIGCMVRSLHSQRELLNRIEAHSARACVRNRSSGHLVAVDVSDVSVFADYRSNVVYLDFPLRMNGSELTEIVLQFPNLQSCDIHAEYLSDTQMYDIASMPKLQRLRFYRTEVTIDGIAALGGSLRLEELELGGAQVGDSVLDAIPSIKGLRKLWLFDTACTAKGARVLARCESLEEVAILRGEVEDGDDWLMGLASARCLKRLVLDQAVSDNGLAAIPRFCKLEELELRKAHRISEVGFRAIARGRGLRRLTVCGGVPGLSGTKAIAQMDSLEVLDLEGVAVGDALAAEISNLKSLKRLRLRQCGLSDSGLHLLGSSLSLEQITAGPGITLEGVRDLKAARPNIRLVITAN
jgi:hypothetical protein